MARTELLLSLRGKPAIYPVHCLPDRSANRQASVPSDHPPSSLRCTPARCRLQRRSCSAAATLLTRGGATRVRRDEQKPWSCRAAATSTGQPPRTPAHHGHQRSRAQTREPHQATNARVATRASRTVVDGAVTAGARGSWTLAAATARRRAGEGEAAPRASSLGDRSRPSARLPGARAPARTWGRGKRQRNLPGCG